MGHGVIERPRSTMRQEAPVNTSVASIHTPGALSPKVKSEKRARLSASRTSCSGLRVAHGVEAGVRQDGHLLLVVEHEDAFTQDAEAPPRRRQRLLSGGSGELVVERAGVPAATIVECQERFVIHERSFAR
jgi:hypothetical protein